MQTTVMYSASNDRMKFAAGRCLLTMTRVGGLASKQLYSSLKAALQFESRVRCISATVLTPDIHQVIEPLSFVLSLDLRFESELEFA